MSEPDFVIPFSNRTRGGSLRTSDLRIVRSKLMAQGFALLPSDTCYSLAAYAAHDDTYANINKILSRDGSPISLCASDYETALKWIDNKNFVALTLLEQFTPGPITVVCSPSEALRPNSRFFEKTISATNNMIGIRIPDSVVERQVSATHDAYLITTVAVRNPTSKLVVTDFIEAVELVKRGIIAFGGAGWCAIEGGTFYDSHSTVVQANRNGAQLIREGDIPFSKIESASKIMPSMAYEDWG